ncbi:MAG: hypothetical protein O3A00_05170 [Planctomycetota bacterium]|nr:hypothetical protein [Planctomycetota bacterium]
MSGFTPEELASVLKRLDSAGWDAVLVGGQAVNVWANCYQQDVSDWNVLRPFTSVDLDYHGGPATAKFAMRELNARGKINKGFDPSPNAGVLVVSMPNGQELTIDILTGLFGVGSSEIERSAVRLAGSGALSGLELRVIHPLLLLEAKAAALRGLDQSSRQDDKHLRLMLLVVREWIRERLDEPRQVFRSVERIGTCATTTDGLTAFTNGIDILDAIPWDQMKTSDGYFEFFDKRHPQLVEQVAHKRERHLDALRDD